MRLQRAVLLLAAAGVALAGAGTAWAAADDGRPYHVEVVMPDAGGLVKGSRVELDGERVGLVKSIRVRDGQAAVQASIGRRHAPLRSGTTARVEYFSVLGERILSLSGPRSGRTPLPNGALIPGTARTDLDDVLAALDEPTRIRLAALLRDVDGVFAGREDAAADTVSAAGPAVGAATDVLRALGRDGPALRSLVTDLGTIVERLTGRRAELRQIIDGFDAGLAPVAERSDALRAGLAELPATVSAASDVLGAVPGTAGRLEPLLGDLGRTAARLPGVAGDLRPLLADLRPALADLGPVLSGLRAVLHQAPGLLDGATELSSQLNSTVSALLPVVDYLRPYTPELAGFAANWGGAMAGFDLNGHYARILAKGGPGQINLHPGAPVPGAGVNRQRPPGALEGQPWTDANGDRVR
ncbi:MAG: MlaD family protein [Actinomycetota bacterium]|jgi:phospholipid/cholesterol/gamma-HCH transport system substrate-binding protein